MGFFDNEQDSVREAGQKTFVKWNLGVGQSFEGTVTHGGMVDHPFPDADKQAAGKQLKRVPKLVFVGADDTEYDLTATQTDLINAIIKASPGKGDHVKITHVENVKTGQPQPMKKFQVVVNGNQKATAPANTSGTSPF